MAFQIREKSSLMSTVRIRRLVCSHISVSNPIFFFFFFFTLFMSQCFNLNLSPKVKSRVLVKEVEADVKCRNEVGLEGMKCFFSHLH